MQLDESVIRQVRVQPGRRADLAGRPTVVALPWATGSRQDRKDAADQALQSSVTELEAAQELLYATDTHAVLVVLQGLDAAGKDGTIKHVMSGLNPQGCEVTSFKQPSDEELHHDFLWRVSRALPRRGHIGIFNRSHYEDVLVVRVHPQLLGALHLPAAPPTEKRESDAADRFWQQRFQDINDFEHHLHRNGTTIVKIFLHISREEQKRRLLERLDDPNKHWKFSAADLAERQNWDQYQHAYEAALSATSTAWAPWYVIPADDKHVSRALVAGILAGRIDDLGLAMPDVGDDVRRQIVVAKAQLQAE